jgi:hypothetical protein
MSDTYNSVSKALIKIVDAEIYRYGYTIVSDFVDFMLWRCTDGPTGLTVKFTQDKVTVLIKMMECLQLSEPFEDVFGTVYEYTASKSKASAYGQFFTPEHVSQMMAMLVLGNDKADHTLKLQEPCCGSGRSVLQASKILRGRGDRYEWTCIDLDPICVKMCVVNCFLNSIPGIFFYGDTLRGEMYYCYTIELVFVEGYMMPLLQYHDSTSDAFIRLRENLFPTMVATPKPEPLTLFGDLTEYVEVKTKAYNKAITKTQSGDTSEQLSLF